MRRLVQDPDDLALALMGVLFAGLLVGWWRAARRNDALYARGGEGAVKAAMDGPAPEGGPAEDLPGARVHTWPHLLRVELLGAMALLAVLGVWTILVDAPLGAVADPGRTPNPARAPWYFVGLQELLVYFDPWLAGAVIPALIVVGLGAIPYLDTRPGGVGYFAIEGRRWPLAIFLFGFVGLWLPLIVIGSFFRGAGWAFCWPWAPVDAAAIAAPAARDLPALLGVSSPGASMAVGGVTLGAYYGIALALAFSGRARRSATFRRLGPGRIGIAVFLGVSMLGLPLKMGLRLLFGVKYVLVTPWFAI